MDYEVFYAGLKKGQTQKVYLFEGDEEYGKESALRALRAAVLSGPAAMLNETTLVNPDESALIAVCETLPILAERRLVIVRDFNPLLGNRKEEEGESPAREAAKKDAGGIAAYLEKLPEFLCLVFFMRGKASATRKLYRKIKALDGVVVFDPLDAGKLVRWVAKELREYGKRVDQKTAEQLIFVCGRDMMSLKNEIAKLAAHAGDREAMTMEDIDALATKSVEYSVFDLAENVSSGNTAQALRLLKEMLQGGEQRLMLLALIQRQYRQLYFAKILAQDGQIQGRIEKELGVPGFVARRLLSSARAYEADQLKRAYRLCIKQEFLVKSGAINEDGSLEQLVFSLLSIRNEKGGIGNARIR